MEVPHKPNLPVVAGSEQMLTAFNMQDTKNKGHDHLSGHFLLISLQITCDESLTLDMLMVVVLPPWFGLESNTFSGIWLI